MHMAETIMRAHLKDKQSTVASVGALYALLIAARPMHSNIDWLGVHNAMKDRFQPDSEQEWLKKLDRIKVHGWRLHDALCSAQKEEAY